MVLGLAKGHYFINGTTTLTTYFCSDNYEEVKYIKGCKQHVQDKK